jgi:hypothetical protein
MAAMRLVRCWLTMAAVMFVAARASGQQMPDVSLLPPPNADPSIAPDVPIDASSAVIDESAISVPWQPPAAAAPSAIGDSPVPQPTEESLPAPAGSEDPSKVAGEVGSSGVVVGEQPTTWYKRVFLIVPAPWDTGVELGLNGSAGTSDSFSLRTGGYIKRKSRFSKLDLSSYYNRTGNGGEVTQNNAQFDVRNDWLLDDQSPWTLFFTNTEFYDQFKDFDLQMNVDLGVGYRVFHDEDLELIGRVGGGTSREFGGPDDRWVPESLFGFEFGCQLNATQKFYGKLDYFPEWDQVGEYRLVADTGWEVVLVQPSNLSLKISANDRYDSTPSGAEPHLVNYSVMLLLKL